MKPPTWLWKLSTAPAAALLLLLSGAAWGLSPWRLGRMLRTVSLPRMREHALRTTLTVLGVALGVGVWVAVMVASRSVLLGVTATMDELAGKADLQVQAGSSGFDEAVIDKIGAVPGVSRVAPFMRQIVTARGARAQSERVLLLGVQLLGNDDDQFRSYESPELDAIRRDPLSFLNSPTNVILSRRVAERLGVKLHDEVEIGSGSGKQRFQVWGFIADQGVAGAFGGAVGLMYYPAMQVAFDRGRNIDSVDVAVRVGSDPQGVARALSAVLGDGFTVKPPALHGERVAKMLVAVRLGLAMASLVALATGAFLVFSTVAIGISQRKRELGIVRALGATRGQLLRLLTLEGVLFGTVGSALGVVAGAAMSQGMLKLTTRAVDQVYLQVAVSKVQVDVPLVTAGFLLGIGGAAAAAWFAAQRAGAIRPVEALSSAGATVTVSARTQRGAELAGLVLIALTLLLLQLPPLDGLAGHAACITLVLGSRLFMPRMVRVVHGALAGWGRKFLGVEATLATDNLPRDLGRTAATASGLMMAVGLTVCVTSFTTSFLTSVDTWAEQNTPGDLFVTSGASLSSMGARNTPLSDGLRAELMAIPGVELIRRIRTSEVDFQEDVIKISSSDTEVWAQRGQLPLIEGVEDEVVASLKRGAVAVSDNFARRFGVERGSTISLSAKHGTRRFEVAGVLRDYTWQNGTVIMDRATYVEHFGDARIDTYELHLRKGANAETARQAINARLSDPFDLFVLTNREYRDELVHTLGSVFSMMDVLELVTLLVAALGLVTAVLANVIDRVREIGVLRALGMLRVQVRKIVMVEATLTGAIGLLAGVVLGMALGYIQVKQVTAAQMGWHLPYEMPWSALALIVVVTLPISALAGFFPARTAARLIVSDALEYE